MAGGAAGPTVGRAEDWGGEFASPSGQHEKRCSKRESIEPKRYDDTAEERRKQEILMALIPSPTPTSPWGRQIASPFGQRSSKRESIEPKRYDDTAEERRKQEIKDAARKEEEAARKKEMQEARRKKDKAEYWGGRIASPSEQQEQRSSKRESTEPKRYDDTAEERRKQEIKDAARKEEEAARKKEMQEARRKKDEVARRILPGRQAAKPKAEPKPEPKPKAKPKAKAMPKANPKAKQLKGKSSKSNARAQAPKEPGEEDEDDEEDEEGGEEEEGGGGRVQMNNSAADEPIKSTKGMKRAKVRKLEGGGVSLNPRMDHPWPAIVEGEPKTLFEGDDVYVMCDEKNPFDVEKDVICELCGEVPDNDVLLLECDECLQGFHLGCLDPPLRDIPESEWLCKTCSSGDGGRRKDIEPRTARELFQAGKIYMARIDEIFDHVVPGKKKSEQYFSARWYCLPEDTHVGRQKHHAAREVFLTAHTDLVPRDSILRTSKPPAEFERETSGDDVFLLEYCYDQFWQRFLKTTEREEFGWAQDERVMWDDSDDSDHEYDGREARRGGGAGRGGKGKKRGAAGRGSDGREGHKAKALKNKEGTKEWFQSVGSRGNVEGFGVVEIPEAVRNKGPQTLLSRARDSLALSAIPKQMPCRGKEREKISEFVENSVTRGGGGKCLYIAGVPGSGKTATVYEVIRSMRQKMDRKEVPRFKFVEVNGLRLATPQHAYTAIWEQLTSERCSPARAAELLDARFGGTGRVGKGGHETTVLLVDEVDLLVTRKQEVLYNMFGWPAETGPKLLVIAIANTMDLPERLLPKIQSRLGENRVSFVPYTRRQLEEIITSRLSDVEGAFNPRAITLAAAKVANVSGDIRRALELCRRAVEIAEKRIALCASGHSQAQRDEVERDEEVTKVTLSDVNVSMTEMFNACHTAMIGGLCIIDKIVLGGLVVEMRLSGVAEATAERVHERVLKICTRHGEVPPTLSGVVASAARMGASRLLLCDDPRMHRLMRMSLNVPSDDVAFALSKEEMNCDVTWLKQHVHVDSG